MVFSTTQFLFLFLPLTLFVYYVIGNKFKNYWLLLVSLLFFGWSQPRYLLYYFQCWDKQSIYPEYFPKTVLQYGKESMTDGVIKTLQEKTDVVVISPKQELIESKEKYQPYSKYGDATHWTQRGAFVAYQALMQKINEYNGDEYKILQEDDYDITLKDMGSTLFGAIHIVDMLENFEIKNPTFSLTNEKLTLFSEAVKHKFFTNDAVANRTRVLILGDSYIDLFLIDDFAQSFYETILIWSDYGNEFEAIVSAYEPDIVIIENAERVDRYSKFADGFLRMKENAEGN